MEENLKIKNLLKKVLENREFVYSFEDEVNSWNNDDETIYDEYSLKFHMEVTKVIGTGLDTVANVDVIIDKILLNDEDFYYDWEDSDYSENVWYIDYLHDHLINEVFDVFPFSIYPTFYGHDEEINS